MNLIIGLGNPEPKFHKTRHNMGFDVINKIAKKFEIDVSKSKYNSLYGTGTIEDEKVVLVKPQTFMNLSGKSVKSFIKFFKVPLDKVLIIYDDMDVEIGKIKVRKTGGPGAHNGMKSIIEELGEKDFSRIRVGIGRPEEIDFDVIDYVIGKIDDETYEKLEPGIDRAVDAISLYLKKGVDFTMNKFN